MKKMSKAFKKLIEKTKLEMEEERVKEEEY